MIAKRQGLEVTSASFGVSHGRLVRIGQVSEMLGITRRAIRHYEHRGLVKTVRGPGSARLFDEAARRRLEWIAKLRLTGIGLRDIEEILTLEARGGLQPQLQLTLKKLDDRAAQLRASVEEVEAAADLIRVALEASAVGAPSSN
jgi:DNA-binding transcriptional MerR regulator